MLGRNAPRLLKQIVPPLLAFILGYCWALAGSEEQTQTELENVIQIVYTFHVLNVFLGASIVHRPISFLVNIDPLQPGKQSTEGHHQTNVAQCFQEESQFSILLCGR